MNKTTKGAGIQRVFPFATRSFKKYGPPVLVLLLSVAGPACHLLPSSLDNSTAKGLFQYANQLKNKGSYKQALTYFNQLKDRYLYSGLVKETDLAIADIYFLQSHWSQATKAYIKFSKMYPRHPQIDRVLFRVALSFFYQLPTTPDRDISLARKTLQYLRQHLKRFPNSSYKKQNKEYTHKVTSLMAQNQWMVAQFHLSAGRVHSARPYLQTLIRDFAKSKPTGVPPIEKLKKMLKIKKNNPPKKNHQ